MDWFLLAFDIDLHGIGEHTYQLTCTDRPTNLYPVRGAVGLHSVLITDLVLGLCTSFKGTSHMKLCAGHHLWSSSSCQMETAQHPWPPACLANWRVERHRKETVM
jgi:hypothetical protein